jgi:flagellar FliL protein
MVERAKYEEATATSGLSSETSSGALGFIVAMIVLSVIAAAGGGIFGLVGIGRMHEAAASKREKPAESTSMRFAGATTVRSLAPVVTNLAGPNGTWVRLEAAIMLEGDLGKEEGVLASRITEDIVAFLRTIPLAQIEGASGFQHLREDLNDRARVRSNGKVRELVIQSLVVE